METAEEVLTLMLQDLPRVSVKKHAGHASFLLGKKVFAFTRDEGVAMKLPQDKIHELAGRDDVSMLVMGKRIMNEWVVLTHQDPGSYKKDLELFKASAAFAGRKR